VGRASLFRAEEATAHVQVTARRIDPVAMIAGNADRAAHVRHSPGSRPGQAVADQVRVAGLELVEEKNGLEAMTVKSDVLPPRDHHSVERSVQAADRVRVAGMSGPVVMTAARAVPILHARPNEAAIVPMTVRCLPRP